MACKELFDWIDRALQTADKGSVKFEVTVSMLEIYNEHIQDLLVEKRTEGGLKIRENKEGDVYVDSLSRLPVHSYDEIER